jgi:hypothetical protein
MPAATKAKKNHAFPALDWDVPIDAGPASDRGERFAAAGERPEGAGTGDRPRKAGGGDTEAIRRTRAAARAAIEAVCYAAQPGGKPVSIDSEEAAIRTVIVGALMGHFEAGERAFDALFAMQQAEAIVKALKIGGYEIKRFSR